MQEAVYLIAVEAPSREGQLIADTLASLSVLKLGQKPFHIKLPY